MEPIIIRIMDFINRHELFKKGDRVLLSLSAGKDSMFLFHVMNLLRGETGIEAGIFHLNHLKRGEESDREEDYLRRLGRLHGMKTHIHRHDFSSDRTPGTSFEEEARQVRYQMLKDIAAAQNYSVIATAHSRDDHIETVLMRIFTGTGIHGLQGIPVRRGNIIRPLLTITTNEIYDYLNTHGIEWREDSTNAEASYARNYIRHEILPRVLKKFPMAAESIKSLSEVAGETMALLNGMVDEKFKSIAEVQGDALLIDADSLKHDYLIYSHAVSVLIRTHFDHQVNRNMLQEIYSKYCIKRANMSLYCDKKIRADKVSRSGKSWLKISKAETTEKVTPQWEYRVNMKDTQEQKLELNEIGISITIKVTDYGFFEKFYKNNGYIFVTLENNIESLYIRNRRDGDIIRTENGTKKVKKLFIERKFDNASKERVPLLVSGNTIMACMTGLMSDVPNRIAADFLVDKKSQKVLAVFKN